MNHPLVASAGQVRDQIQPDEIVRLRHLVAVAINDGSGPLGPETRDRDVDAIRAAVLDQLSVDAPPQVAAIWRDYLARTAADPPVAAPAPAPEPEAPTGRPLAGLDVDLVDDGTRLNDELHTLDDVVTLCDMLAARDAVPPISVGLFGKWGSGKSYFMALMRRRIDELRDAAVDAKAHGRETSYCSEIVQITFNAWHYMDADDLWATLAVHLFGAIAQVDPDDDRARPRADVVRDLEARERQMEPVDRKITRALGDRRLDGAAASMGLDAPREDVLGLVREIGTTIGYVSAGKVLFSGTKWTTRRRWALAGVAAIVAVIAVLAGLMISGAVSTAWLLAWIPLAGTVVGTARRWLRGIKNGLAQVNRVAAESGLQPHEVTDARIEKDGKILELRAELEAIDQFTEIRDWVQERALSTDYTSHFGVISVLRGDLEALVEKQRRDAPDRRIILYIDDLDRCPPTRVVEVLQAVHLLLAFPLFVAVVGVDPRWLLRSLERHYRQVLSASDNDRAADDVLTATTPHDYLEKIFQVPFALRRMDRAGYGRLVASLTGAPAPGAPSTADGAGDGGIRDGAADATRPDAIPPAAVQEAATGEPGADPDGPPSVPAEAPPVGAVAARETAAPSPAGTGPLAPVSANPPQLQITPPEVAALAQMGPLIPTPRAAKRLVNLYRLIRAGLLDEEIDPFVADADYRPLAIVLAIQVGHGQVASALLAELVNGDDGGATISKRITTGPSSVPRSHPLSADWESLKAGLSAVCVDDDGHPIPEFDRPLSELRRWMPRLRRYSFEGALGPS